MSAEALREAVAYLQVELEELRAAAAAGAKSAPIAIATRERWIAGLERRIAARTFFAVGPCAPAIQA